MEAQHVEILNCIVHENVPPGPPDAGVFFSKVTHGLLRHGIMAGNVGRGIIRKPDHLSRIRVNRSVCWRIARSVGKRSIELAP